MADTLSSHSSGLGTGHNADAWRVFDLRAENELRLEVSDDTQSTAQLRLLRGTAEVLGRELALHQSFDLRPGSRLGVFTWHGCRVEVRGSFHVPPYIAEETPNPLVMNIHAVLQRQREQSFRTGRDGRSNKTPRVAVVGPHDSGKLTVAATLAAYALRHLGARLAWLDLDPGAGFGPCSRLTAVPGALVMMSLHRPLLALEDAAAFERPICWYFGHFYPHDNAKSYLTLIGAIRRQLDAWMTEVDAKAAKAGDQGADTEAPPLYNAGCIAVLPAWTETRESFDLLADALHELSPTCVVVLESERLYALLRQSYDDRVNTDTNQRVDLVRIPKSGGVVPRDTSIRRAERAKRFRSYFYGLHGELHPHPLWLPTADILLYRICERALAPLTALPLGETFPDQESLEIEFLTELQEEMLHTVGAVSQASEQELAARLPNVISGASAAPPAAEASSHIDAPSTVWERPHLDDPTIVARMVGTPVFGFVQITAVDRFRGRLRILSPSPGKLPSKLLQVSTDLRWIE